MLLIKIPVWPVATLCHRIHGGIGDIFKLLKDLKIDQNTMVVFTSDSGPSIESYLPKEYANYSPEFFNSFGPFDGIKRDVLSLLELQNPVTGLFSPHHKHTVLHHCGDRIFQSRTVYQE